MLHDDSFMESLNLFRSMKLKVAANIGDVFLIPVDSEQYALAQLVSDWNGELYVAVFDHKVSALDVPLNTVVDLEPMFLALTLDAKLFHGDWPIIGNVQENLADFPQPAYQVRQSGIVYLESRDRSISRPATEAEAAVLKFRTGYSPMVLEKAVKAHFGAGEWLIHYEDFRATYAYRTNQFL